MFRAKELIKPVGTFPMNSASVPANEVTNRGKIEGIAESAWELLRPN